MTVTDAGPHPCDLALWEGELIGSRYERAFAVDANRGRSVCFPPHPGYYSDAM